MTDPLLELRDLRVWFPIGDGLFRAKRNLRAVDGIDLRVAPGEALGIVGESGCGKSTLARAILRLVRTSGGQVVWLGKPIEGWSTSRVRPLRRDMQIVFQDPLASLDPRMTVGEIVAEPLRVHARDLSRAERRERVIDILARVGLPADVVNRYPHEFSGGQCQRIGIARAMVMRWGMSDVVGNIDYSEAHQGYTGNTGGFSVSADTKTLIENEVKALIDEGYDTARKILLEKNDEFERLAQGLLEYETLTGDEIRKVIAGQKLHGDDDKPSTGGGTTSVLSIPKTRGKAAKAGLEPSA